jgi:hypothetical protein
MARGKSSICHGRATRRSGLNFSVSVMIAAENGPYGPPALFLRFTAIPAQVGPGVRIRLAPAGSQERTPHRRCTICGVGFTDVIRVFTDVIRVSLSTANRCARLQGSGQSQLLCSTERTVASSGRGNAARLRDPDAARLCRPRRHRQ